MTIIAGLEINNYSFLISDTLITNKSNDVDSYEYNAIPTLGDVSNFVTQDDYNILGLLTKIEIINDHFVISWAGDVFKAKVIIKKIKMEFRNRIPTHQEIFDCIDEANCVQFIWIIKNDSGLELRGYNAKENHGKKYFDKSVVAGTNDSIVEEADDIFKSKSKSITIDDVVADSACTALFMFSHLMNHEMLMKDKANTLNDKFGGYYDLVIFYDNKFQRLNEVTFIFLDANTNDSGIIIINGSGSIIKQCLNNEEIIVNKINFEAIEGLGDEVLLSKITYNESFSIQSTLNGSDFIAKNSFSSPFVCVITRCDSSIGHHCLINKYETSEIAEQKTIKITRIRKLLKLEFNQDFFKSYESELMSFYNGKNNG
ncbi:TPA: hypothetical protein RG731_000189 [Morganella morganii subsp. morganii]|nr:hypothetical protein [Morganella morganii subsp. morganii]